MKVFDTKSRAGGKILLVPDEAELPEVVAAEAEVLDVEPEAGGEGGGCPDVLAVLSVGPRVQL